MAPPTGSPPPSVLLLLLLLLPLLLPAANAGCECETGKTVGVTALHNSVRCAHSVAPLVWEPKLARMATERAQDTCRSAKGRISASSMLTYERQAALTCERQTTTDY